MNSSADQVADYWTLFWCFNLVTAVLVLCGVLYSPVYLGQALSSTGCAIMAFNAIKQQLKINRMSQTIQEQQLYLKSLSAVESCYCAEWAPESKTS